MRRACVPGVGAQAGNPDQALDHVLVVRHENEISQTTDVAPAGAAPEAPIRGRVR
ncbi:hypothetical protein ABT373_09070 [Streptomyces sp. NPDC000070]|uniref:hypothetical protein n=1 Tax=Streptomyces sp. NPDC000070 TaxID=3154240 RepID=UPI00331662EB